MSGWGTWEGVMISDQNKNDMTMFRIELPRSMHDCITILDLGRKHIMCYVVNDDETGEWVIKTTSSRNEYSMRLTCQDSDKVMGTYCSMSPFDAGHFEMTPVANNSNKSEKKKHKRRSSSCFIM